MDSLFSFPVGLFHPLQHAGLSRRTPDCRRSRNDRTQARLSELAATQSSNAVWQNNCSYTETLSTRSNPPLPETTGLARFHPAE